MWPARATTKMFLEFKRVTFGASSLQLKNYFAINTYFAIYFASYVLAYLLRKILWNYRRVAQYIDMDCGVS